MALRGKKKPEASTVRLKSLMFGKAGVGKTMAAIQMPSPYIIDTEKGTDHYGSMIEKGGGAVFQTVDMLEAIQEVRALATEKHNFKTLVIDPFTSLYDTEVEKGEKKVGSEWGKHYGYANKNAKRLYNLLTQLDMNIVMTCHQKNEYGDDMKIIGQTFDGWKKLDYLFDVVFYLDRNTQKSNNKRIATITKTRMKEFPDLATFEWSYENLVERYGKERLEKGVQSLVLASKEDVEKFKSAYKDLNEDEIKKLKIDKVISSIDEIEDFPEERVLKGLEIIDNYKKAIGGK